MLVIAGVQVATGPPTYAAAGDAVQAWGRNDDGQTTVPDAAKSGVVAVAAGEYHNLALKSDGRVIAWGESYFGKTTVPVAAQSGVVGIAAGYDHSLAVKSDGSVVAWGRGDYYGQTTVPPAAQSGVIQVAAGAYHSLALKSDGSVVAWGDDGSGQATVPAAALSGVIQVAAGDWHNLALKSDGSVVAWGADGDGQSTVPPAAQSGVIAVAAGGFHSLALKSDGSVVAWGWNGHEQTTVPAAAQSGVVGIAAGFTHSLAVKADGSVVAWGDDNYGEATAPSGLGQVAQVAAGCYDSVVLDDWGRVGLTQPTQTAQENAGTVTLTVTRESLTHDGVSQPGSVAYLVTDGTATPGTDFTLGGGTVSFAVGETSKTIRVPLIDDTRAEGAETVVVGLGQPSFGTALGAATTTLTIRASDQQPDALISMKAGSGYVGNNVYNTTGANQTKTVTGRRTQTRAFYVRVANDGNVTNIFRLTGSAAPTGSTVKYYSGATNITTAMRSTAGYATTLAPGATQTIKVTITISGRARIGSTKTAILRAAWTGDGIRTDVVKAAVRVTSRSRTLIPVKKAGVLSCMDVT